MLRLAGANLDGFAEMTLNGRVVAIGIALSVLAPLGFALMPALRLSRPDMDELRQGNRGAESTRGRRLRESLVVAQVALALILMTQVGLIGRTTWKLHHLERGFDADRPADAANEPRRVGVIATPPQRTISTRERSIGFGAFPESRRRRRLRRFQLPIARRASVSRFKAGRTRCLVRSLKPHEPVSAPTIFRRCVCRLFAGGVSRARISPARRPWRSSAAKRCAGTGPTKIQSGAA